MGRIVLGAILGLALVAACALAWLCCGCLPLAVADPPLPLEKPLAQLALHARMARQQPKTVPLAADEANLVAGAEVYRDHCAACHGFHNKPVAFAAHMAPPVPQLWEQHAQGGAVGVSGEPVPALYWKVANGIRLTGMPAYKDALSDREIWQVTLLVANADKPLPPGALSILRPLPVP